MRQQAASVATEEQIAAAEEADDPLTAFAQLLAELDASKGTGDAGPPVEAEELEEEVVD